MPQICFLLFPGLTAALHFLTPLQLSEAVKRFNSWNVDGSDGATARKPPAGSFVSLSSSISWPFADDPEDSEALGDAGATRWKILGP